MRDVPSGGVAACPRVPRQVGLPPCRLVLETDSYAMLAREGYPPALLIHLVNLRVLCCVFWVPLRQLDGMRQLQTLQVE